MSTPRPAPYRASRLDAGSATPGAPRWRRALLLAALTLPLVGCEILQPIAEAALDPDAGGVEPQMLAPEVSASGLELRRRPSLTSLGAWYCPKVLTGTAGAIGCTVALGSPPAKDSLRFDFGLKVVIKNPNDVPVPALDVLVALTLYPGQDAEELGALCVSLCGADDVKCDGTPREGACTVDDKTVKSLDDLVEKRLPNLIEGILTGEAQKELEKSTVAAGGDVTLDLVFSMGVDQALTVFQRTALDWVQQLVDGKDPTLTVPVQASGSVFFNVPVLGKLAVDYGPLETSWTVE